MEESQDADPAGTVYHYTTDTGKLGRRTLISSEEERVVYETIMGEQRVPSRRALSRRAWRRWLKRTSLTSVVRPAP
jgi:hypothetical protein